MSNNLTRNIADLVDKTVTADNVLQAGVEARAVAEVQAQYVIAKKFPRDQNQAFINIMDACKRPTLAENAIYAYPRGNKTVTGPSIRLAEAIAQCWGNLDCGVRELSQSGGVSIMEAYAIDLQTNTRLTKVFNVEHKRDTKQGSKRLTDNRDIYELTANQGARRLRACILGIIPGDIVEAAVDRCTQTLASSDIPIAERIRKMTVLFDELGVKVEHLEKRLGHNLDATIPAEIVGLQAIYKSIKDGHANREDFFEIMSVKASDAKQALAELVEKKWSKEADKADKVDPETGEVLPKDMQ